MQLKCIELCIKVTTYTQEYYIIPIAEYDNIAYTQTIYMNLYSKHINDMNITCDFHEIVRYVKTEEFAKKYKVHEKSGIVFLHNGYPVIGFKNKAGYSDQLLVTIDINNYIFNKEIYNKLRKIEIVQKRNKMYFDIIVILGIIAISVSCFILYKSR